MAGRIDKIALGGGCHWCTEAVFLALRGVKIVDQGFVASTGEANSFSEAIIVHFDPLLISLHQLIEIHLNTHRSTSAHSMRAKYRSAVYYFNEEQKESAIKILEDLNPYFKNKIITEVLPFNKFKPSAEQFQNYYFKDPAKPFCQTYIDPKLKILLKQFSSLLKKE